MAVTLLSRTTLTPGTFLKTPFLVASIPLWHSHESPITLTTLDAISGLLRQKPCLIASLPPMQRTVSIPLLMKRSVEHPISPKPAKSLPFFLRFSAERAYPRNGHPGQIEGGLTSGLIAGTVDSLCALISTKSLRKSMTSCGVQSVRTEYSGLPMTAMPAASIFSCKNLSPSSKTKSFPLIFDANSRILFTGTGFAIDIESIDGLRPALRRASLTMISLSPTTTIPKLSVPFVSVMKSLLFSTNSRTCGIL